MERSKGSYVPLNAEARDEDSLHALALSHSLVICKRLIWGFGCVCVALLIICCVLVAQIAQDTIAEAAGSK